MKLLVYATEMYATEKKRDGGTADTEKRATTWPVYVVNHPGPGQRAKEGKFPLFAGCSRSTLDSTYSYTVCASVLALP